MVFDMKLAERVRRELSKQPELSERKMFGGLCFMLSGNMCCGVINDTLMARVGPEQYQECLRQPHAREMDFTGKPLKGMIYVAPEGIRDAKRLRAWLARCVTFAGALPPK